MTHIGKLASEAALCLLAVSAAGTSNCQGYVASNIQEMDRTVTTHLTCRKNHVIFTVPISKS
jgi:hypothetical protein